MAAYTWTRGVSGLWGVGTGWTPAAVPNDLTAAVSIDAAPVNGAYTVTIFQGETAIVNSLTLNATNNAAGTNVAPYDAATLAIEGGTLDYGPGSTGLLAGPLQSIVLMNNGTIDNPGTLNAFIQGQGNDLFVGTNGIYITNWLQALSGTVTIDTTSIAELTGNTLFDGIFEAAGTGALVDLGGPIEHMIVNIATIEGPPLIPGGWTELYLDGPTDYIREWNGTGYVNLETTLTEIGARGTMDVLGGRTYTTANAMTIAAGGDLVLGTAAFNASLLDVNGGVVQGSGSIGSNVSNLGTIIAEGGTLNITGTVTSTLGTTAGTGTIGFDFDHKNGTIGAGSVLELHAVTAGETVVMNGDDILKLDAPAAFQGTISAQVGDQILLGGVNATSATLANGLLTLSNGATVVDTIHLAGNYAGDTFELTPVAGGTTLTVAGTLPNFRVQDASLGTQLNTAGVPYAGTIAGVQNTFTDLSPTNLYITTYKPNAFITTGAGNDTINVSNGGGINVLDGGTGSNTLIGATAGTNLFQVNDASPSASISDVIQNFHSGDYLTIFGISPGAYTVGAQTVVGANNVNELVYTITAANKPSATVTLVGHSFSDISSGQITASYGTTTGTASGTPILNIHAV